jgi:predicted NAD/FAD-binding protein
MNHSSSSSPHTPAPAQRSRAAIPFDLDVRIGIIGAGPAGLSAARALLKKGFRHVTVLEREGRVGGKCYTFIHDGRTHELGALMLTSSYTHVRALLKELGIRPNRSASNRLPPVDWYRASLIPPLLIDADSPRGRFLPSIIRNEPLSRIGASWLRLCAEMIRNRSLYEPGFCNLPPQTLVPFEQWARERRCTEAAHLISDVLFTPLGYGYASEAPAPYVIKIFTLTSPPLFELYDSGYQGLWEAVARGVDVRLNVTVRRVRRAEQVVVETECESMTFDALVVTSPMDEAVSFLDATAEEADLAAKIRYQDYRVVVASVTGLPDHRYVLFPRHLDSSTRGEVTLWYRRWSGDDVHVFYTYGREGTSMEETTARVAETVGRAGGNVTKVHRVMKWRYCPQVSLEDMAHGFFDRVDAMQGARHTYYAGELLGLGTVETTVRQAHDLIARHFVASSK